MASWVHLVFNNKLKFTLLLLEAMCLTSARGKDTLKRTSVYLSSLHPSPFPFHFPEVSLEQHLSSSWVKELKKARIHPFQLNYKQERAIFWLLPWRNMMAFSQMSERSPMETGDNSEWFSYRWTNVQKPDPQSSWKTHCSPVPRVGIMFWTSPLYVCMPLTLPPCNTGHFQIATAEVNKTGNITYKK